jgi:hypothetical protein
MTIEISSIIAYNELVKMKGFWPALLLICLLASLYGIHPTLAQESLPPDGGQRYFPETGHLVTGDFLKAYESVPNPDLVYGNPITEAFSNPIFGKKIQYFEKARFEQVPSNPAELRVHITELGRLLYEPGPTLPTPGNSTACKTFLETKNRVCYAFLDFFEANGGEAQFGYPISNFELHDQRIVQYFQRARFEWHPELPEGQKVQLSKLGYTYFYTIGEDPARLDAVQILPGSNMPQLVLSLKVSAFTERSVLPQTGQQTIYIVVQDQNLLPVHDAEVSLIIMFPSGQVEKIKIPGKTDGLGVLSYTISYHDQTPGMVKVVATAYYEKLKNQTETSFRIWW